MLTHGTPIWTSVPAYDVARAREFYSTLFNWTYKDNTEQYPAEQIAMFSFPNEHFQKLNVGGGIIKVKDGEKITPQTSGGTTTLFLMVDNVDDVVSKVEGAGGKVVSPKEKESESGEMATLMDTEGNSIGIYAFIKK